MTPSDRDALLLLTARLALRLAEHPCDFTSGVELRRMLEAVDEPRLSTEQDILDLEAARARTRYARQAALGAVAAPNPAGSVPAPCSAPPGWLARAWGTWRTGR